MYLLILILGLKISDGTGEDSFVYSLFAQKRIDENIYCFTHCASFLKENQRLFIIMSRSSAKLV